MNPKIRLTLIFAGALALASGGALAFGGHGHYKGECDHHRDRGLRAVYRLDDLTAEQRQAIDALRDEMRADVKARRETRRAEHQALTDAIRGGADEATVRPLAEKQARQVEEMILRRAELHRKLNAILTPEQQQRLEERATDRHGYEES